MTLKLYVKLYYFFPSESIVTQVPDNDYLIVLSDDIRSIELIIQIDSFILRWKGLPVLCLCRFRKIAWNKYQKEGNGCRE